jgi:hypothetical protein
MPPPSLHEKIMPITRGPQSMEDLEEMMLELAFSILLGLAVLGIIAFAALVVSKLFQGQR